MSDVFQARGTETTGSPMAPAIYSPRGRRRTRPDYEVAAAAARLIQVRRDAGYQSAAEAATKMGVNVVTYQHHENGRRAISPKSAESYAAFFGVTPSFILYGDLLPHSSGVPIVGIVGARGFVHMLQTEERTITVPPPPGDPETLLLPMMVDGSDLYPAYHHGDTIWYDPDELDSNIDAARVKGRDCVVRLIDGRTVVRRVMFVEAQSNIASLGTYAGDDVLRAPITGAARIEWVKKQG